MSPLQTLRHHVTGAIERGEATAIAEQREPINYEVTITLADGYTFRNGFATVDQVREFLTNAAIVLQPGETATWRVL